MKYVWLNWNHYSKLKIIGHWYYYVWFIFSATSKREITFGTLSYFVAQIWKWYLRLDDMLKCLKTEVKGKERSLFIGTFSELEKEKKDRKYTTSSV